jgi:hypothetical protein
MIPYERSLVQKMQNQPFALLGVNSDEDREQLKEVVKKEQITWRSFWAGGTSGPIPTRWQVTGWPTIIIIDKKGIIRHKHVGNPGDSVLDGQIDKLVKEPDTQEVS